MRNKLKVTLTIIGMVVLCSWITPTDKPIQKVQWLIGTWENKMAQGSIYETWKKVDENELLGKSYMLKGKDTVLFETVQLKLKKDKLYYIPVVKGQNDEKPVSFELKSISDEEMVFQNLNHDFPQIISYKKNGHDSLIAEISDAKREKKQAFHMKKFK